MKKIIFWPPRVMSILFTTFIGIFAFDVFAGPQWLLSFLLHLIPTSILVVITIVAWKNETVGGFLFIVAGFALLIFTHFEALVIGIPAFVIGLLFMTYKFLVKNTK